MQNGKAIRVLECRVHDLTTFVYTELELAQSSTWYSKVWLIDMIYGALG